MSETTTPAFRPGSYECSEPDCGHWANHSGPHISTAQSNLPRSSELEAEHFHGFCTPLECPYCQDENTARVRPRMVD